MRILMVSHSIATWTTDFARFFVKRKHDVLVASFSPETIDGIDTIHIGPDPFDPTRDKHMYFTRAFQLRRIIRTFTPDIVYAIYLTSNGLTVALAWKGPFVVSAVGSDVLDRSSRTGFKKWFRENVIKYVAGRADVVNTVSGELDDELIRLGIAESKLLRIPFGVDLTKFHPSDDMPRAQTTRMICTRRHAPIYDIPTIIEALAQLKKKGRKFHCTLTSGGPLLENHKTRVRELGLEEVVTFTGFLKHGELPERLRQADIYISASLGDGTSVSLLEAIATGLIPVISNIRANRPWIEHKRTGLFFEVGNPEGLINALEVAMDDKELRDRAYQEGAGRIVRECDFHRNLACLENVFQQIVEGNKPDFDAARKASVDKTETVKTDSHTNDSGDGLC